MDFTSEQPVSPIGQYLSTSPLSLSILAILEFQVPIQALDLISFIQHIFLRINPRFSSIMVTNQKGERKWKRVNVKPEEHVKAPIFPPGLTHESYRIRFDEYLSSISMEQFQPDNPPWEIHSFKYPTSESAAGTIILKLHHCLGDGYSIMGVVLSCLRRASDPDLPLTFPSKRRRFDVAGGGLKSVPRILSAVWGTVRDLAWSFCRGEDDRTPIRSGGEGVEFLPAVTSTVSFSLQDVKEIKTKLGVTVNDVITGMIFLGLRLYIQEMERESARSQSTLLVIMNTRVIGSYKSATEMINPQSRGLWGNQLSYLQIPVPDWSPDPLRFVKEAHRSIKKKRRSFATHITGHLLDLKRKLRGHQEVAKFLHDLMKQSSTLISNVIGPHEQMAYDNFPVSGLYFTLVGIPQSIVVTIFSYMGHLRVAFRTEKEFINSQKLNSCMEDAFNKIIKAAKDEEISSISTVVKKRS